VQVGKGRVVPIEEWAEVATPDIYFSPEYHATSGLADANPSVSILLEWCDEGGKVYLPLIVREIPGTNFLDATSAYGYGGPWTEGTPDRFAFRDYYEQWAQDNSVVTSFLRFHPMLKNYREFQDVFTTVKVGQTALWDLTTEDLIKGMSKNHRKNWRRAIREGVEARITPNPVRVDEFRALYETSMARVGATKSYWLNENYWGSLRDRLGDASLLVEAIYKNQVVAAAWCLLSEKYLHFHLSGTLDVGRRVGGAYVCRVAAAQWAKERGLSQAHHGGGMGGSQSSLLDWKRKFDESNRMGEFHIAKIIHNDPAFTQLSVNSPRTDYFPPWRAKDETVLTR